MFVFTSYSSAVFRIKTNDFDFRRFVFLFFNELILKSFLGWWGRVEEVAIWSKQSKDFF